MRCLLRPGRSPLLVITRIPSIISRLEVACAVREMVPVPCRVSHGPMEQEGDVAEDVEREDRVLHEGLTLGTPVATCPPAFPWRGESISTSLALQPYKGGPLGGEYPFGIIR